MVNCTLYTLYGQQSLATAEVAKVRAGVGKVQSKRKAYKEGSEEKETRGVVAELQRRPRIKPRYGIMESN